MKDSFKELSLFISPRLRYLGFNAKAQRRYDFQYINWLHCNTTIQMYTQG